MFRIVTAVALASACSSLAAEKPVITYKAPTGGDVDDRPVITQIIFAPQGTDYAFKIAFNKEPWGEACRTRCANATLFLDTDNNRATGLSMTDPKAAETGADLAITIQGIRVLKESETGQTLRVKVLHFGEGVTSVEGGETIAELDARVDTERVLAENKNVFLLIDGSMSDVPTGMKVRLVYHPPDSGALSGMGKGLAVKSSGHVDLFKDGKLSNPKKKKSDYEKY